MAYGRLDVFWPDGAFETHALNTANVSVGRSSGNVIILETTSISRYHFNISYDTETQETQLTDLASSNGTYIDGVKLVSETPHVLGGGEEIQIGDLRLIFHSSDDSPTQPITALAGATQRIVVEAPEFNIDIQGPDQSTAPGAHISAHLTINNTGDKVCRYQVTVAGLPEGWVRVDRPSPTVQPDGSADVVLNFKPSRRSASAPGEYPVAVAVSDREAPEKSLQAAVTLHVLPFNGFGMALTRRVIPNKSPFRLHTHNQGNANLPLTVNLRDLSGGLRFELPIRQFTLTPGQRMVVQGEARPKRLRLFGGQREYPFDVTIQSQDAAQFVAAERAYLVEHPPLPTWSIAVFGGGFALLALAAIVVLALLLSSTPQPIIDSFAISGFQVAQDETLELAWEVTNAEEIRVALNGTPVVSGLEPENSRRISLPVNEYSGDVRVELIATNGSKQTVAADVVRVYRPLQVEHFTIEPLQLVRYVVQPLRVSWQVSGAIQTRLDGLQNFSVTPLETTYGPAAVIGDIVGIPLDSFTIILQAEGEIGNAIEQRFTVDVIDPECSAVTEAARLYFGPDFAHQVVGTLPSGVSVVVDSQDESGAWLRAQLPGGVSGWGPRTAFNCNANFAVENLRKELNVPPVPTATPTFTPSPSPAPTATRRPPTATPAATPTPA